MTSTVLGRYEVSNKKKDYLGEGAFSVVRKGLDKQTGQDVAVKSYKPTSGASMKDILKRFVHQIEALEVRSLEISLRVNTPFNWPDHLGSFLRATFTRALASFWFPCRGEAGMYTGYETIITSGLNTTFSS